MKPSDDFAPLEKAFVLKQLARPEAGYWEGAWQRLKANPRAILSLYLIIVLLMFSTIGPLIWKVNPSHQDLSQLSQAPSFGKTIRVVDVKPWYVPRLEASNLLGNEKLSGLALFNDGIGEGSAHTESVKLIWKAEAQADYYKIYRHDFRPSGVKDLGLPLRETENQLEIYFEDKLKLEAKPYFYSVQALRKHGGNSPESLSIQTIKVNVEQVVSKAQAKSHIAKGLWMFPENQPLSLNIRLPAHPMGTDSLGRDMMARLMWGGKTSLLIGVFASIFFVLAGSMYGAVSAYFGGRVDNLLMRFSDFIIALPFLLFMILLKVSFGLGPGESGIGVMIFSLIILSWPASARLVRAQVLVLKEQNFVLAAKTNGAGVLYIVRKHLLPNVMSVIFVSLSFAIPSVILTEAFLSFIGLGVVAPTPSWGAMCQEGIKTFLFYPHELIFPATFIGVTVLAFNLLGDGLRDALDVKNEVGK